MDFMDLEDIESITHVESLIQYQKLMEMDIALPDFDYDQAAIDLEQRIKECNKEIAEENKQINDPNNKDTPINFMNLSDLKRCLDIYTFGLETIKQVQLETSNICSLLQTIFDNFPKINNAHLTITLIKESECVTNKVVSYIKEKIPDHLDYNYDKFSENVNIFYKKSIEE